LTNNVKLPPPPTQHHSRSNHKLVALLFAVRKGVRVVDVRECLVPWVDEVVELTVRVRLALAEEVGKLQHVVLVVAGANLRCVCVCVCVWRRKESFKRGETEGGT